MLAPDLEKIRRLLGEIREQAVDPQPIELQVLVHRVALVVGDEALLLVAESPGVHEEPRLVRSLDHVSRRQELAARLARTGQASRHRADDVALPRTDAVGVGLHLAQARVGDEEAEGARKQTRIAGRRPVEGPVGRRGEVESAVGVHVVGVDQLISRTGVMRRSSFRFDCSKDWMITGASRRFQPAAARMLTSRRSIGRPSDLW